MTRASDVTSVRALARREKPRTEEDGAARRRSIRGRDPIAERLTDRDMLDHASRFGDNGHTQVPRDFIPRK